VSFNARAIEPKVGCEVRPEKLSIAASTASAPAAAAASTLAAAAPPVSWVWKWIGRPVSAFSVLTRISAARGRHRPAMSLIPRICAPAACISRASLT
jgi:hypothetical protein